MTSLDDDPLERSALERMHIIKEARAERPTRLRLVYADGQVVTVELAALVRAGGVFAALRDWELFSQAALDERGRAVRWPGDIDLCADALRIEGEISARRRAPRGARRVRTPVSNRRRS